MVGLKEKSEPPLLRLDTRGEEAEPPRVTGSGIAVCVCCGPGATTDRKDSACHSYHTCRSLVRRQMETCSSELLGRYSGSYEHQHMSKPEQVIDG